MTAWLQMLGEAERLEVHGRLHENIAQYMHSGSRRARGRRTASTSIGISFEYRANREKAQGKPIDLVFPKEGLGWDLEAIAHHKGTKKLDGRARSCSTGRSRDAAMELYAKNFAIVAVPGAVAAAAERAGRLRQAAREERLRVGGEEPRQDPRRVDEALRVEGGAEVA